MFEDLLSVLSGGTPSGVPPAGEAPGLRGEPGYARLLRTVPHGTLGAGVYRLHDSLSATWAAEWLAAAQDGTSQLVPFAYDWLGRQYALAESAAGGMREVVLCDPFGAQVQLGLSFDEFHRHYLPRHHEDVLSIETFQAWVSAKAIPLPMERDQCAVYVLSPRLGGAAEPENLRLGTLVDQRELSLFTFSDGRRPGERCAEIVSELLLAGMLSEALRHEDPLVRAHAIVYWSPAIPATDLMEALRDESAPVRDAAAMRLMDVEPTPDTVAALTEAVDDPDEDVRWSAEFALQQLRGGLLQKVLDAAQAHQDPPGHA